MKIISINAGSSSLKFSLINMENENVIANGVFERIGIDGHYKIKFEGKTYEEDTELKNHSDAVNILLEKLINLKIVKSLDEIEGVGHRVVQGKDVFDKSVIVDDDVLQKLESIKHFAPLHNPANMLGIKAFMKALPNVPNTVVFDTAFHQTMDKETYIYPVPYEWYEKYGIRKYGAHGTSHRYITETVSDILNTKNFKLISCHIGNGASITAVKNGKCVDTSMGFTPLAGVMMGTRSGDIDPSILPPVMEAENKTIDDIINDLNKHSGILGMSGISSDMRDLTEAYNKNDERAILTMNKYARRITDYIAQYYVLLKGTDIIVFTAGIGENSFLTRKLVCDNLKCLGVEIDEDKNKNCHGKELISTPNSKIKIYVIPTDEELMIAKDTLNLIKKK